MNTLMNTGERTIFLNRNHNSPLYQLNKLNRRHHVDSVANLADRGQLTGGGRFFIYVWYPLTRAVGASDQLTPYKQA